MELLKVMQVMQVLIIAAMMKMVVLRSLMMTEWIFTLQSHLKFYLLGWLCVSSTEDATVRFCLDQIYSPPYFN